MDFQFPEHKRDPWNLEFLVWICVLNNTDTVPASQHKHVFSDSLYLVPLFPLGFFGDWCCSRLHKPRARDSPIWRLENKLLPSEVFWCLHQIHGLWTPEEIKGPNTKCLKRHVCVERQELCQYCYEHISKLEIQGSMGPSCVRETENPFHFQCDPS